MTPALSRQQDQHSKFNNPPGDRSAESVLSASSEHVFRDPGYHVWCGSVFYWGERWWLVYSRWKQSHGFEAWATHSEVAVAGGASPLGPFRPEGEIILPGLGSDGWTRDTGHNPTIFLAGEQICMAYTGSFGPYGVANGESGEIPKDDRWWIHRNNQRIGIATASHPLGPWRTPADPTLDTDPEGWDSLCVNNPSVTATPDKKWLMVYKGVTDGPRPFGKEVLHGVAKAERPMGPYQRVPGAHPFQVVGSHFAAEDPFVWWDPGAEVFRAVVKDMDGDLTGAGRSLAFYDSPNGTEWTISHRPPISGTAIKWDDGSLETMRRVERPQVTFDPQGRAVALQVACQSAENDNSSFSLSVPLAGDFFDPTKATR